MSRSAAVTTMTWINAFCGLGPSLLIGRSGENRVDHRGPPRRLQGRHQRRRLDQGRRRESAREQHERRSATTGTACHAAPSDPRIRMISP